MPNIISFTLVKVLLLAEEINFIFWSVLRKNAARKITPIIHQAV